MFRYFTRQFLRFFLLWFVFLSLLFTYSLSLSGCLFPVPPPRPSLSTYNSVSLSASFPLPLPAFDFSFAFSCVCLSISFCPPPLAPSLIFSSFPPPLLYSFFSPISLSPSFSVYIRHSPSLLPFPIPLFLPFFLSFPLFSLSYSKGTAILAKQVLLTARSLSLSQERSEVRRCREKLWEDIYPHKSLHINIRIIPAERQLFMFLFT